MTILVSMGEPAGIGPDICLALAGHVAPLVILGDKTLLAARAALLRLPIVFHDYDEKQTPIVAQNHLTVLHMPGLHSVKAGVLDVRHAAYTIDLLDKATRLCLSGAFQALVTAPVHKAILNHAGFNFTGHTEFLAEIAGVKTVVMFFVTEMMRLALLTTHVPLSHVPALITKARLSETLTILNQALIHDFGVLNPHIGVAGLNPHAGEAGCLGSEELTVIEPALQDLSKKGLRLSGPLPADTLFTKVGMQGFDALLAMYHDQGLSVLKYASFGSAVNITLGLPMIRTSVDHGTALDLAGTGRADAGSLIVAVNQAAMMVKHRERQYVES
jgi:4-hydroxythreonine-4-phosphate dehydrogenase